MLQFSPYGAIGSAPVVQLCWAVDDIERATERWTKATGIGPFFIVRHVPLIDVTFFSKPATFDHSAAFAQWGGVQVELMQQHCDSPSALRIQCPRGESRLITATWFVNDVSAEIHRMNGLGFPTAFTCTDPNSGAVVAWFDTRPLLGTMVEVYKDNPIMRRLYQLVEEAAIQWDGYDPLRPIESLYEKL